MGATTRRSRFFGKRALALFSVWAAMVAAMAPVFGGAASGQGPVTAPFPEELRIVTLGNNLLFDLETDLAKISEGFNAVLINGRLFSQGWTETAEAAQAAGLSVILVIDGKEEWLAGDEDYVNDTVDGVIENIRANPGLISGVKVADEFNFSQHRPPAFLIEYLSVTGGVFKQEIPELTVLVDVISYELWCGLPRQARCSTPPLNPVNRYKTNDVLVQMYETGYVDGFFIGNGTWYSDYDASRVMYERARAMFPEPFLIYARTAKLAFKPARYSRTAAIAERDVRAMVQAPLDGGTDGYHLWTWSWNPEAPWTLTNKDFSQNYLWDLLVSHNMDHEPPPTTTTTTTEPTTTTTTEPTTTTLPPPVYSSARVTGGNLIITGGNGDDGVLVESGPTKNSFVVTLFDVTQPDVPLVREFSGVTGRIQATLKAGDDSFSAIGIASAHDIIVSAGGGDDSVTISGTTAGRTLKVIGSSGDDSLVIENSSITNLVTVSAGGGNDDVAISGSTFNGTPSVSMGGGNDSVSVADSDFLASPKFNGQAGSDSFTDGGGIDGAALRLIGFETSLP